MEQRSIGVRGHNLNSVGIAEPFAGPRNKSLLGTYAHFTGRGVSRLLLICYLFDLLISLLAVKRQ